MSPAPDGIRSLAKGHARTGLLCLLLTAIVLALYLPWLGHTDLMHEETRRAVIARTMMATGNYFVPMLAEEIYLSKPPLFNWMIVATSLPVGTVTEWTARLPTVISLAVLAVTMVLTAGRHLSRPAQWLLGLATIVTGEVMNKALLGNVDVAFTMLVSASLWVWYTLDERGYRGLSLWLAPAVLVAAAFLVKREPALVFYYLGVGGFLVTQRRWRELFQPPHLIAAAVTLALASLWLGPIIASVGLDAVVANFEDQVVERGVSSQLVDYATHIVRYPLEILVAALPSALLLVPLAWPSIRKAVHRHHGRLFVFATVVVLVNLPIYWFRADAAVRYFLPMMPTMVALAAMVFDTLRAEPQRWPVGARRTLAVLTLIPGALALVFAGVMIAASVPGAFPDIAGPVVPWPAMMAFGLATLAAIGYPVMRYRRDLPVVVFVAIVGAGIAGRVMMLGFYPAYEAERIQADNDDVPAILERVRAELPDDIERVQAIGRIHHAFWFYDRDDLIVPVARMARGHAPASPYLLVWSEAGVDPQWRDLETERVARIPYEDGAIRLLRLVEGPSD